MPARYPGLIRRVQVVTRNSFGSGTINDTISAVQTDRTMLLLANSGNNRIYGSTEYHIHVDLYDSTTVRWTCSHANSSAYYQVLLVIEFYEPFKAISTASTGTLGGTVAGGGASFANYDVTISPPAGYDVTRAVCLPATLLPDYSGNPVHFYAFLLNATTVRFARTYSTDVSRAMKARVYWF